MEDVGCIFLDTWLDLIQKQLVILLQPKFVSNMGVMIVTRSLQQRFEIVDHFSSMNFKKHLGANWGTVPINC